MLKNRRRRRHRRGISYAGQSSSNFNIRTLNLHKIIFEDLDSQIPEKNDEAMDVGDDLDGGSNVPDKDYVASSRASGSNRSSSSKKRKRSDDDISEMVDQIKMWRDLYDVATRGIEKIASFFDKSEEKGKNLLAAIEDLGILDQMQTIDIFEAMCKEPHKIDVFIALSEARRGQYVMRILDESSHMGSTCMFCGSLTIRGKPTSGRASIFEDKCKKAKVSGRSI